MNTDTTIVDPLDDDQIIRRALDLLAQRLRQPGAVLESPRHVKDFLVCELAQEEREVFGVVFLDAQHRVICYERMFTGTLSQTSVYPREVVKAALAHNAAAVILSHNHPSGIPEPSRADEHLTQVLKTALALVDIRVIDHIVVGGIHTTSLAERGLI